MHFREQLVSMRSPIREILSGGQSGKNRQYVYFLQEKGTLFAGF